MKNNLYILLISLVVISCNNISKNSNSTTNESASVETKENKTFSALPDFQIKDQNGSILNLQSFKGKKIFLNLWASWCGPCRGEMPAIQSLYKKVKNQNVAFVLLGLDEDFEKSKAFMNENNLTMPLFAPGAELPELLNVPGIPTTFIFDESGQLIKKIEGGNDYDTEEYVQLLSSH